MREISVLINIDVIPVLADEFWQRSACSVYLLRTGKKYFENRL